MKNIIYPGKCPVKRNNGQYRLDILVQLLIKRRKRSQRKSIYVVLYFKGYTIRHDLHSIQDYTAQLFHVEMKSEQNILKKDKTGKLCTCTQMVLTPSIFLKL